MTNKGTKALALCLGATVAMTACTRKLDMDKLKNELKSGLTSQLGVQLKDVTCPEAREIKPGDSFECKASGQAGAAITLKVTQNDDQGNVKWEVSASEGLLDLKALESQIGAGLHEQEGLQVTVDCGGKFREAEPAKTFDCKATDTEGHPATVTVTMKDKAGAVDWKLNAAAGQ